jgi:dCTP deaminase
MAGAHPWGWRPGTLRPGRQPQTMQGDGVLLVDSDILAELRCGRLTVSPLTGGQVQPASIDLHLAGELRVFPAGQVLDPGDPAGSVTELRTIEDDGVYALQPGEFALGCTQESVTLPADLAAQIDGVSTCGRLGLMVHSTAGWVDPGFTGQLTLELSNVNSVPIALRAGARVAQLCIFRCTGPAAAPYDGRYQSQTGPTPPRRRRRANRGSAQSNVTY